MEVTISGLKNGKAGTQTGVAASGDQRLLENMFELPDLLVKRKEKKEGKLMCQFLTDMVVYDS